MKKILVTIFMCVMVSASCQKQSPAPNPPPAPANTASSSVTQNVSTLYNKKIQVKDKILNVQVVISSTDMQRGLSGRLLMNADESMLFIFNRKTSPGFWMIDMNFGLDMIWVADGKIVGITANVPPPAPEEKLDTKKLKLYYPPSPIDRVLEVNAGWAEKNNVSVGDEVKLIEE